MTRLYNDPGQFVDEMIDGLVQANARWVRRVDGGVVRRLAVTRPTVAVVIGGGSGHYPAFAGIVGQGLAHGAVMGNVFASPSTEQVVNVALNCQSGAGVLLTYGNYAGDVLNFDEAQERLIARGIPCRTVVVTDDVMSAPAEEAHRRRGIAGDLAVFKVAGAAAEEGLSLDEVVRIATRANERCRSFGVAFGGCTLPGASAPLFEIPRGRMAVGMGIHGEPGTGEVDMPSADDLAELFVATLLAEVPSQVSSPRGARAVVFLNGLGGVKYEELFVVYRRVAKLLTDAGITVVDPRVGELVTSFDMAGASLTLFWLDEQLEALWMADAVSPAFSQISDVPHARTVPSGVEPAASGATAIDVAMADVTEIPPATPESQSAAELLAAALGAVRKSVDAHVEELGRLDAVAGDGDHGIGMQRGARAAAEAANDACGRGAGVRTTLEHAAEAWANRAGGASGALWGVALLAFAHELSDSTRPSSAVLQNGVAAALHAIERVGKAKLGDKTLLDALEPFASSLNDALRSGVGVEETWTRSAASATAAAEGTAQMLANIGRARLHATRSVGSPDPGAVSFALVAEAAVASLVGAGSVSNAGAHA